MSSLVGTPFKELQESVKWFHATMKDNLEHLWRGIMLVKDEFLAKQSIEQPDHEKYVWRISSMNRIKAMTEEHLKAQPERHTQRHTIFRNVSNIFVRTCRQPVLVNVNVLNACVRLPVLFVPFRTNDTHLKAVIT